MAQRWHVPPWVIEDEGDPEWILRGFAYMQIEASVKVTKASRSKRG